MNTPTTQDSPGQAWAEFDKEMDTPRSPMKTYEIIAKAQTTIVVVAESEGRALEVASGEIHNPPGWEIDEWSIAGELTAREEITRAIKYSTFHQEHGVTEPFSEND